MDGTGYPRQLRGVRADVRWLAVWTPAVSLAVGSVAFLIASQVTCTAGCPVPLIDPRSTVQDLVHTSSAVVGFACAALAMVQVAAARHLGALSVFSLVVGVLVAVIASTGGLFSVFGFRTDIGSWLEFVAMTLGVAWVAVYAFAMVRRGRP